MLYPPNPQVPVTITPAAVTGTKIRRRPSCHPRRSWRALLLRQLQQQSAPAAPRPSTPRRTLQTILSRADRHRRCPLPGAAPLLLLFQQLHFPCCLGIFVLVRKRSMAKPNRFPRFPGSVPEGGTDPPCAPPRVRRPRNSRWGTERIRAPPSGMGPGNQRKRLGFAVYLFMRSKKNLSAARAPPPLDAAGL